MAEQPHITITIGLESHGIATAYRCVINEKYEGGLVQISDGVPYMQYDHVIDDGVVYLNAVN